MSYVLVVVIARDYLYLFVSFSLKLPFLGLDSIYGLEALQRQGSDNIFTKPLGSEVVRLLIQKVKFGIAFVVHVGVETADVCAGTSDNVGSSDPNVGTSDSD